MSAKEIARLGDVALVPGMLVEVFIKSGDRPRIEGYALSPKRKIKNPSGKHLGFMSKRVDGFTISPLEMYFRHFFSPWQGAALPSTTTGREFAGMARNE